MVFTYISNTSDEPTVEGFLKWNPNNTYQLIRQLVFTYTLAIMVNKLCYRNTEYWMLKIYGAFLRFQSSYIPGNRMP